MIWQACLLKGTLAKLGEQTVATQDAARASITSATAAMGVAVPTLAVLNFSIQPQGSVGIGSALSSPRIEITVKNYGQSPAFVKSFSIMVTYQNIEEMPTEPNYAWVESSGDVVDPGGTWKVGEGTAYAFVVRPTIR